MAQIKITPEELETAATFLSQKEQSITAEVDALKAKIDETAANWEGASQSSFVETFESQMYPVLHETLPQVIEGIMSQLNAAAKTLRETDEQLAASLKG